MSFHKKALSFYKSLEIIKKLPLGVKVMNPYKDPQTLFYLNEFLKKFFSDNKKRIFVLGINPGRFGGGVSGVNFTDGFALKEYCGIRNRLDKKRELSSSFIYKFIQEWGGVETFYSKFFLSAISPLGFTKNGKNFNYYDDRRFSGFIEEFIVDTLNKQIGVGAKREIAIILGTGKNRKYFEVLNNRYHFFDKYVVLEHPRFIMQYKRKLIKNYLQKYKETFKKALLTQ